MRTLWAITWDVSIRRSYDSDGDR